MRIGIFPKTSLGRWSVGLVVIWILFFVLSEVLTGFEVFGPGFNLALALILTVVLIAVSGAILVTALISVIKRKERSVSVFVAGAIGLYGLVGAVVSLVIRPV